MREFIINNNDAGQRVDKFLTKAVKRLPVSLMYKYIRLKRIKLNGKKCDIKTKLCEGDVLSLYINDEFFDENKASDFLCASSSLDIVYEDENILIADKKVGLVVHEDNDCSADTLINRIKKYLFEKREYDPDGENSFAPALCNRIDRNTQGLVICAKNAESLRILNEKIKKREVKKEYLCVCLGKFKKKSDKISAFLLKDEKSNTVKIMSSPTKNAKSIVTGYRVIRETDELSLVEIDLITGRTHQIRAHMASIGHPLLGDGKYGRNDENKRYHVKTQALCAHRIKFDFSKDCGMLEYLNGKEFLSKMPWFVEKLFSK